jgi:hypothetical protein
MCISRTEYSLRRKFRNKTSVLSIRWICLLCATASDFAHNAPLFGEGAEEPAMLGLLGDSLYCVLINTMPEAVSYLLDFGLGPSAEYEGIGPVVSIGMYAL